MATARATAARRRQRSKANGEKARGLVVSGRGRPTLYDPAETPDAAFKYALLGLNEAEIAAALGVDEKTLTTWKRRYPEFVDKLRRGKDVADAEVANSLYMRAKGGLRMPAVKIFLPKDVTKPVYAPYEEVLPPDVQAARLWLTNRQPLRWRDRREVEVSGGIEHQLSLLSAADREARLAALLEKAGRIIEGEAVEIAASDDDATGEGGSE